MPQLGGSLTKNVIGSPHSFKVITDGRSPHHMAGPGWSSTPKSFNGAGVALHLTAAIKTLKRAEPSILPMGRPFFVLGGFRVSKIEGE
jgi:hypothetical protein